MQKRSFEISDVVEITPRRHEDDRGYFSEVFRADWFAENIAAKTFVQTNQSLSVAAGVIRGLHFQRAPSSQGKLVRCLAGAVFDVVADIRLGSATYGQWISVELSPERGNQLWIPTGFLHGFCTLVPNTIVSYQVTAYYDPQREGGVLWDDPDLAIDWPQGADPLTLSAKDRELPRLQDLPPEVFA